MVALLYPFHLTLLDLTCSYGLVPVVRVVGLEGLKRQTQTPKAIETREDVSARRAAASTNPLEWMP